MPWYTSSPPPRTGRAKKAPARRCPAAPRSRRRSPPRELGSSPAPGPPRGWPPRRRRRLQLVQGLLGQARVHLGRGAAERFGRLGAPGLDPRGEGLGGLGLREVFGLLGRQREGVVMPGTVQAAAGPRQSALADQKAIARLRRDGQLGVEAGPSTCPGRTRLTRSNHRNGPASPTPLIWSPLAGEGRRRRARYISGECGVSAKLKLVRPPAPAPPPSTREERRGRSSAGVRC